MSMLQHEAGAERLAEFRAAVLEHYRVSGRDLPWRRTRDPYAILVSEVMLQQTQVARVAAKYEEFLRAFPSVEALAGAPLADVLRAWSGLGYNRRAKALHEAAKGIAERHGGRVPSTYEELRALPGVGHATAAQVLAFAFGVAVPYLETNIRAALIHWFFPDEHGVPDRALMPLVEATLDREDPRTWYYALMDYGAALKRSTPNPSRRSAHHGKQAPFAGSAREARGAALRALAEVEAASVEEVASRSGIARERIARALEALEREGLAVRVDGRWRLPR
ncbi:A/G-specific adenine glycosylase [Coriobacteriia bacterium Es71-Z0120]|uniref:A/G-specific adenine glycosylase n=1 Tax=Parvivirga hydrogeniphila TaxID=2939460 RepID=UPI0022608D27|nr:A/G-specific adenine glycosylase [Parvivirga hydrogeniphila]MCL4078270.1 A/G-specific adenine glycosylase [Parvivirga hydrogeniphila]